MIYGQLTTKYDEVKAIATAKGDGRTVYAVGAIDDTEYGYIGKKKAKVVDIPDEAKIVPVDSFFKMMPMVEWDYF